MKTLGTVLPTPASLAASEAYARRVASDKEQIASRELRGCTRRVIGGEVRYYRTAEKYAIVSRRGAVLWFVVTPDGDRRI